LFELETKTKQFHTANCKGSSKTPQNWWGPQSGI